MKRGLLILLLTGACVWPSTAQKYAFELWHEGKIILLNGDTLKGLVKYDLQQDLVQFMINQSAPEVFTARKILFFEIFDTTVQRYRQFFSLPYTTHTGYRAPVFFELLEEGRMTLLSRELLEYKTVNNAYMSYSRWVLSDYFFFMKEDGSIEDFKGNKNDLLDRMGRQADDVEKFIRQNRLKFDEKYDLARIVSYYNSLFGT